jgi:hypothetical protein
MSTKMTAHYTDGGSDKLDLEHEDFQELWLSGRWNQKDIQRVEFEDNSHINFREPAPKLTPL